MEYINSYLKLSNAADEILNRQRTSSRRVDSSSLVPRRDPSSGREKLKELDSETVATGYMASIKDTFSEEEEMARIKSYLQEQGLTVVEQADEDTTKPFSRAEGLGVSSLEGDDWVDLSSSILKEFEGFSNKPYYDVNAFRAGYGSDTYTTAEGTIKTVKKGDFISREDAERDLQRRITTEFGVKAKQAAGDAWDSYNDLQKAALTSIAYNYGSIPKRIQGAVQSGDPEKVYQAILTLVGDNDGINAKRRRKEAEMMIYGGTS